MLLRYIIGFKVILGIFNVHRSLFGMPKLIKIFDSNFSTLFVYLREIHRVFIKVLLQC